MNNIDIFHTIIYTKTKLHYTTPYTIVYFTVYYTIYKTSSIFLTSFLHHKISQLINDSRIKLSIKIDNIYFVLISKRDCGLCISNLVFPAWICQAVHCICHMVIGRERAIHKILTSKVSRSFEWLEIVWYALLMGKADGELTECLIHESNECIHMSTLALECLVWLGSFAIWLRMPTDLGQSQWQQCRA